MEGDILGRRRIEQGDLMPSDQQELQGSPPTSDDVMSIDDSGLPSREHTSTHLNQLRLSVGHVARVMGEAREATRRNRVNRAGYRSDRSV